MTPILQGLTTLTFVFVAEVGVLITQFNRTTTREMTWVYDAALGYDIGFVAHNPDAQYSVAGKKNSALGLALASPGIALSLANPTTGNGVTGGGIYSQSIASSHAEKGFVELSVSAIQKPGIA